MAKLNKLPGDSKQGKECEDSILGACLSSRPRLEEVFSRAKRTWFLWPENQALFDALKSFYTNRHYPSPRAVFEHLQREANAKAAGGFERLHSLDANYRKLPVGDALDALSRLYCRRSLVLMSNGVLKAISSDEHEDNILDEVHEQLAGLTGGTEQLRLKTLTDILGDAEAFDASLTERRENAERGITAMHGPTTGFNSFDGYLLGLQPKDLVVIGAMPGTGKSELLCQWMARGAIRGVKSIYVSLEMSDVKLATRIIGILSSVHPAKIGSGKFTKEEQTRIMENYAKARAFESNCMILDAGRISLASLRHKALQLMAQDRLDVIYLDYVQKLVAPMGTKNYYEAVSENSQGLKALAKELDICVVSAAQMSRPDRSITDINKTEPQIWHLRESGYLEQDADVIILPWRKEYFDPSIEPGYTRYLIKKNRDRETGQIIAYYNKETADITEVPTTIEDHMNEINKSQADAEAFDRQLRGLHED